MKELVEGECGGANALLQMTSHLTKDQSLLQVCIYIADVYTFVCLHV